MNFEQEIGNSSFNVTVLLVKLFKQYFVVDKVRHLVASIEEELDAIDLAFDR